MANADAKKSNRWSIIILLAIFTIPIGFAWTAYFTGMMPKVSSTNKGELIQPVIDFRAFEPMYSGEALVFEPDQQWRLILPIDNPACLESEEEDGCLLSIYIMGQAHQALGRRQDRVTRTLYIGDMDLSTEKQDALVERFVNLNIVTGKPLANSALSADYIYIADPLGNIMLRYPLIKDKEQAFLKGKNIFQDLKKLLRISRIG